MLSDANPEKLGFTNLMIGLFIFLSISRLPLSDWNLYVKYFGWVVSLVFILTFRFKSRIPSEIILYAAFCIFPSLFYLFNDDNDFLERFLTVVQILILLSMISLTCTTLKTQIYYFLMVFCGVGTIVFSSYFGGHLTHSLSEDSRLTISEMNPNGFGRYMILAIVCLTFWTILMRPTLLRIACAGSLVVFFSYLTILSQSRFSIIGLGIFLCLLPFVYFRMSLARKPYLVVCSILISFGFMAFLTFWISKSAVSSRFNWLSQSKIRSEASLEDREALYELGYRVFSENPIYGVGFGHFLKRSAGRGGHSDIVELFSQTGVLGALPYFGIYVVFFTRLIRVSRLSAEKLYKKAVKLFFITGLTIVFLSLGAPAYYSKPHWIVMGCMIGLSFSTLNQLKRGLNRQAYSQIVPEHFAERSAL